MDEHSPGNSVNIMCFKLRSVVTDLVERFYLLGLQAEESRHRLPDEMRENLPIGEGTVCTTLNGGKIALGFRTRDRSGRHLAVWHVDAVASAGRFKDGDVVISNLMPSARLPVCRVTTI